MPLKRQHGFIYGNDADTHTMAHELGHGVFGLKHPFSEYDDFPEGTTDLLMDYGEGTRLSHMDWKTVHAPGLQLYLFQKDEEGEMTGEDEDVSAFLNGGWKECLDNKREASPNSYLDLSTKSLPIRYVSENCYSGTLYILEKGEYIWTQQEEGNAHSYWIYDEVSDSWLSFKIPTKCTSCDLNWLIKEVAVTSVRYLTPLEDGLILLSGKDLEGVESSQVLAGGFLLIEIVPGGKFLRPIKKLFKVKKARKIFSIFGKNKKIVGEVDGDVFKPGKWIEDEGVEVVEVLNNQRYLDKSGKEVVGNLEVVKKGDNVGVRAAKSSSKLPNLGRKLDFVFGKATGNAHNVQRSTDMLRNLNRIGIQDNAAGRALLRGHLNQTFNSAKEIIQSNGRVLRESLLMGPRGSVQVNSIWEGNKLITIMLKGGG